MYEQIPVEVMEQYEGKWIIWEQEAKRVVGSGDTLDEAEDQAASSDHGQLLRVHYVIPRDVEIAGML